MTTFGHFGGSKNGHFLTILRFFLFIFSWEFYEFWSFFGTLLKQLFLILFWRDLFFAHFANFYDFFMNFMIFSYFLDLKKRYFFDHFWILFWWALIFLTCTKFCYLLFLSFCVFDTFTFLLHNSYCFIWFDDPVLVLWTLWRRGVSLFITI